MHPRIGQGDHASAECPGARADVSGAVRRHDPGVARMQGEEVGRLLFDRAHQDWAC